MNALEYNTAATRKKTKTIDKTSECSGNNSFRESPQVPLFKSPYLGDEKSSSTALPACDYTIEKSLGKGVFGEVFLATSAEGKRVALKRLPKSGPKFDWKLVNREVEVGKRLKGHEGIVQLESYFETISNVYLVFEFCDGKDLFSLMESRNFQPLEEKDAKKLFKQIVDALLFCHNHSIAHRDIKLDNIIILNGNGKPKLLDFGLASLDEEGDKGCRNFVGSPEYVAPEIVRRVPYSGFKADVFSLGMVLFCLIFGQFPYIPEQQFEVLTKGGLHPPLEWPDQRANFPNFVGRTVKDLISKMLENNPDKRISLQEIANHRWLTGPERDAPTAADVHTLSSSLKQITAC